MKDLCKCDVAISCSKAHLSLSGMEANLLRTSELHWINPVHFSLCHFDLNLACFLENMILSHLNV